MIQVKKAKTLAQALSVLVDASALESRDAKLLTALVQRSKAAESDTEEDDDTAPGAPDAAVYESHSGDIVSVLEDLLDKAKAQLDDARKKETADEHNFKMLEQALNGEIAESKKDMEETKKNLAAAKET